MDDFGNQVEGSMTPPLSPHGQQWYDEAIDDSLVMDQDEVQFGDVGPSHIFIDCSNQEGSDGGEWKPCATGHLYNQVLARILKGQDPHPTLFQNTVCKLFGSNFITSTSLLDSTSMMFSLAKQKLGKLHVNLETTCQRSLKDSEMSDVVGLRQSCILFIQYLIIYIQRYYKINETPGYSGSYSQRLNSLHHTLLFEMQGLSNYLGKVNGLPSTIISQYSSSNLKKQSIGHLVLHLMFNVRWSLLDALHLLFIKTKGSVAENEVSSLLNAEVKTIMADLVTIAKCRFSTISMKDYKNVTPFPCHCVQELWVMLIHFLDQRHTKYGSDSFWFMFHTAVESKEEINAKVHVGLCWWLLVHISPLYNYSQHGEHQNSSKNVRSNWLMVGDLVKVTFSQELSFDEESIRLHLQCCLALCHVWEPSSKTLATLWQYCHKKMNQALLRTEKSLVGLASINKSALSWFEQSKQRRTDHIASCDSENSFHLFLRILAIQLEKMQGPDKMQGWRQIKGRLYSKFHSRSMQDLSNTGLSHFISLFLILAQTADLSDPSQKMLDLLDMLSSNKISYSKQHLIWKGLFALCLIHEEEQHDIAFIAKKLSTAFNKVCSKFCESDIDPTERHHLWTLITCYLDATQDVLDNSSNHLCLSEDKLIGSGFQTLLPVCTESEVRAILQFELNIMACQRSVFKRLCQSTGVGVPRQPLKVNVIQKHGDLVQCLWTGFFPFVKLNSTTSKPNCLIADVAASFTMLALDMEENCMEPYEKLVDLFNYFGLADTTVHYSITIRYLCHLIPNAAVMQSIESHHGMEHQAALIHAWVRCSILTNQKVDELQELSRLIYKLPTMALIMGRVTSSNESDFAQFVRSLGQRFSSAQNLQEKILFRKSTLQIFGDLVKLIQYAMKRMNAAGSDLKWLYKSIGYIVRDCAAVLYVKSKPHQSQLPGLLSELLLPPLLFNPSKTLPSNMLNAIRESLNLFLEGLSTLDFQRDQFIHQKMEEIIQQYFVRFALKCPIMPGSNVVTANHPLLVALYPSQLRQPLDQISNLRQFMIEVLRKNLMVLKGQQVPSQASNAFHFVQELFNRTLASSQTARNTPCLLPTVLNYLLLCDNGGLKKQAANLLATMMDACKNNSSETLNSDLSLVLQSFVDRHLQVHQSSTFQVLESVAVLHPKLLQDLIPHFNEKLAKCEMKRGVGTDSRLRRSYKSLLSHLGQRGQAIMNQIDQGQEVLEY